MPLRTAFAPPSDVETELDTIRTFENSWLVSLAVTSSVLPAEMDPAVGAFTISARALDATLLLAKTKANPRLLAKAGDWAAARVAFDTVAFSTAALTAATPMSPPADTVDPVICANASAGTGEVNRSMPSRRSIDSDDKVPRPPSAVTMSDPIAFTATATPTADPPSELWTVVAAVRASIVVSLVAVTVTSPALVSTSAELLMDASVVPNNWFSDNDPPIAVRVAMARGSVSESASSYPSDSVVMVWAFLASTIRLPLMLTLPPVTDAVTSLSTTFTALAIVN